MNKPLLRYFKETPQKMLCLGILLIIMVTGCKGPGTTPTPTPIDDQIVTVQVPESLQAAPFDVPRKLTVPVGFAIEVIARVPKARFLAVTPTGDVLVSQPFTASGDAATPGKIILIRSGETTNLDFITGLVLPHDMIFHTSDGIAYLYVAAGDQIIRYPYIPGATSVTEGETMVSGLPLQPLEGEDRFRHPLKSLAVKGDTLYVMIASSTNANPADLEVNPKQGAIYTFSASTPDQAASSGTLFAEGIRNAEGLDFAPDTDELWAVVNNRDEALYPFHNDWENDGTGDDYGKLIESFVDNYPPEEIIKVRSGTHYGWPFCNPNPSAGFDNMPFDNDVETNPEDTNFDCATATKIDKGAQAHSAPLGASFWINGPAGFTNSLVVAFHGSWNRSSYVGHKVSFYPYTNSSLGDEDDLVSGWVTDAVAKERWGRPVDVVPMPDGSLFISDDLGGAVYRLYKSQQ
jgi:glucose/arabinose dehydrogenase